MALHIAWNQETMEIIDPNDTIIRTHIIKDLSETAEDQRVAFRYISHEAQTDSKTTHAIVSTAHAHQVVLALGIGVYVE